MKKSNNKRNRGKRRIPAHSSENIFSNIIEKKFLLPTKVQEVYRIPRRLDQKQKILLYIIIKILSVQNTERILKALREKTNWHKARLTRITLDFSGGGSKSQKGLHMLRDHKCSFRLLQPAKLWIARDGENKIFQDKTKFKQHLSINPVIYKVQESTCQP